MSAWSHPVENTGQARVMLVEDSAIVRGMVRNWIDALPGAKVVATADNGQVALDKVAAARPDVIILDIEMPIMDGLTALPGLLRAAPNAKAELLATTVEHIDITSFDARPIIDSMRKMSFSSRDTARAESIADQLETGTVFMNRCDYLDPSLAWTGVKDSGRGCTLSPLGFDQFVRPKSYHLRMPS